jgi:hypothetical protein
MTNLFALKAFAGSQEFLSLGPISSIAAASSAKSPSASAASDRLSFVCRYLALECFHRRNQLLNRGFFCSRAKHFLIMGGGAKANIHVHH